jgi:hypothetical protein
MEHNSDTHNSVNNETMGIIVSINIRPLLSHQGSSRVAQQDRARSNHV